MSQTCDISVAVVGLGGIGALHSGILASLPSTRLVGVVDKEPRLVRMARKAIPNMRFYSTVEDMVTESRPDAVYVCTPASSHVEVVRSLLSSSHRPLGVFVEKPLATNSRDAEELVRLAQAHGTITAVGHQRRLTPTIKKTRELVESGVIGDLGLFRCHHFASSVLSKGEGWRFTPGSGGVAMEFGIHLLDIVIMLFGEPQTIRATSSRLFSESVEDYVGCQLGFKSGLSGVVEMGWSQRGYDPPELRVEIQAQKGAIITTEDAVRLLLPKSGIGPTERIETFYGAGMIPELPFLLGSPENVLIDLDFVSSLRGKLNPQVTFEEAAKVIRLLDAIRESTQAMF